MNEPNVVNRQVILEQVADKGLFVICISSVHLLLSRLFLSFTLLFVVLSCPETNARLEMRKKTCIHVNMSSQWANKNQGKKTYFPDLEILYKNFKLKPSLFSYNNVQEHLLKTLMDLPFTDTSIKKFLPY